MTNRADPFADTLDLTDFTPQAPRKTRPAPAAVKAASEAMNFPSRAPTKAAVLKPDTQRRRRTGRNVQFNIKATPEVIERFAALADRQGWVFGEALERAVEALEKQYPAKK